MYYINIIKRNQDIIPDEVLLAELNNIYNIHYDSKTTFDRLIKDSELLTSKLPVDSRYPVVILLDEANLSPIEYYWAEFMRVADRSSETAMIDIGETKEIYIPETLSFVATINYDQTTEELSPRLIDRSWMFPLLS